MPSLKSFGAISGDRLAVPPLKLFPKSAGSLGQCVEEKPLPIIRGMDMVASPRA